jgi:hypothetical protein
MISRNKRRELAQHVVDRRRREDGAPRLLAEVPALVRLSLAVEERAGGVPCAGAGHTRRIVVEQAAALFEVPCGASSCDGGMHDLTAPVMRELRRGAKGFEGSADCDRCACSLRYVGSAEYR